ncbi:MAG TPA: SGNH/GDSL hydrolase family protein [Gemmata sp.]|nr:SGNH/GDSL hydrolase family protein [Gemmata sp.]
MRRELYLMVFVLLVPATVRADDSPVWVESMKQVHAKFTGKSGTLALFGDSITVTKAFWSPLGYAPKDLPEPLAKNLQSVKTYMLNDCWSKWRGAEYGSESGKTTRWAEENTDTWLKKLNPEAVVLMFGTNDLNQIEAKEYETRSRSVIEKCLKNGTVVILTTIPPQAGMEKKSKEFAEVQRKIAADLKLPLIDYQEEVLKRRPEDWNGGLPQFKTEAAKDGYSVPTLIAADGVHPSNPSKYQDYSEESLNKNGYQLRTVLTLNAYADVIRLVLAPPKK